MAQDRNSLAWAEFGDVLRLPMDPERDPVHAIPWPAAGFMSTLPLIDIGSGSGVTTIAMAEKFPRAEVISIEPDPVMRSLLMLRVAERDGLRARTTVLSESVLDVWLPGRCGGGLLVNVIYFLDRQKRAELWSRLWHVLVPGAQSC